MRIINTSDYQQLINKHMFLQPPNLSFDLAKTIVLCGKSYRLAG